MRVPEMAVAPEPTGAPEPADSPSKPKPKRKRKRQASSIQETAIWDGLLTPPRGAENSLRANLLYPLWGANGVASLILFPPLLWLTSAPALGGLIAIFEGNGSQFALLGLLMFLPTSLGLFAVLGYTLLFLGRVLAASALGEVHHPRWPDWELSAMAFGLGRWLWAGLVGGFIGGLPAVAYWINCGDLDLFNMIILGELAAVGAVYSLMALLASGLHEDLVAANPITVLGAVWTLGWDYLPSCLVAGFSALASAKLFLIAFAMTNAGLAAFFAWLFWVFALYSGMVSLRVLGLCYARNATALGWFRGRTGWGV